MKTLVWRRLDIFFSLLCIFSAFYSEQGWSTTLAHEERGWLRLLHYQSTGSGIWQSSISSSPFFLTQSGSLDPLAEWQALQDAAKPEEWADLACRFPARILFYQAKTGKNWPAAPCAEYLQWKERLNFRSLSLVYSTAYAGNPASVVGHNFLKINIQDSDSDLALLDYGLAFLAQNDPEDGTAAYAWNGLFGGYPGFFILQPYYQLVNTYAYAENRDLWEYEFKLNKQQRELFLAHLWELIHLASTPYYFTHVNCSTMILEILESIRPDWELRQSIKGVVLPQAVIQTVAKVVSMEQQHFWPSQRRIFESRWQLLNHHQQTTFQDWRKSGITLAAANDPLLLDTMIDQINLRKSQLTREEQGDILAEENQVLLARSLMPALPTPLISQREVSNNPLLAHGVHKFSLLLGRKDGDSFWGARLRYGLHDLLDAPQGFNPYYHINFLDLSLATQENIPTPLYDLKLIDLMSLNPFQRSDPSPSWSTSWSWGNAFEPTAPASLQVQGSYGLAWETKRDRSLLIALPDVRLSMRSDGLQLPEQSLGLRLGWFFSLNNRGRQLLEVRPMRSLAKNASLQWDWSLEQRWGLGANRQLEWRLAREKQVKAQIGLSQFF